jgi:hypothetical protein
MSIESASREVECASTDAPSSSANIAAFTASTRRRTRRDPLGDLTDLAAAIHAAILHAPPVRIETRNRAVPHHPASSSSHAE